MKVIIGLGNPGPQYERTRHNAGYRVVDVLARRHATGVLPRSRFKSVCVETTIAGQRCLLMKPTTFMNLSGQAVAEAVGFFKASPSEDLLVISDDVALPVGAIRLRPSGGAGGHNGLSDIQRALGTDAYPRCRVGIDPKPPFMDQADYVLGRFTDEQEVIARPAIERAADAAEHFVSHGITAAMNRFNAPPESVRPKRTPQDRERPAGQPAETPPEIARDTPRNNGPRAERSSGGGGGFGGSAGGGEGSTAKDS